MKELGKLILFDFRTVGGSQVLKVLSGVGVILFLGGMFVMPFAFLYISAMIPLFLISPLTAVAEKSGFGKLYGTLPVNRKNIPRARFLYIFLLCTLSEIVGGLLSVISLAARLYRILPITSPEFRALVLEEFTIGNGIPVMLRMTFFLSMVVMLATAGFTAVKMIHGDASAGIMGMAVASLFLLAALAFFVLNSLDLMPVIELKGLSSMFSKPITALSAVKWAAWHLGAFGVCMLLGEHTSKKLAGREL